MSRRSAVLAALLLVVCSVHSAWGQEQQYDLSNFDVTVHVQPDGSYAVEESITYDFQRGRFSRAYRSIVEEDGGAMRDLRVTSPDARVDSVWVGEHDGTRQVRWRFSERAAPAQFDVRYVLDDAIYERGGRNEVSLDVMADGAVVRTRDVDVRVTLPTDFDLRSDQVALEPAGTVQQEAGRLVATVQRDRVSEGDDYSVEVSFPKQVDGAFLPTGAQLLFAFFLVLGGGGLGAAAVWAWRGPRPEVTAKRPPSALDLPMAVALLEKNDGRAVLSVLFDLVHRGHLTLRHDREDQMLGTNEVIRLDVHPKTEDLSDFERRLVEQLRTYETIDEFWSDTASFRSELMGDRHDELLPRGWMRSHMLRSNVLLGGAFAAILGGLVAVVMGDGAVPFYLFFGGMGASLAGFIAATRRYTWTEEGARLGMALRSYLDYEKGEVERLRETDPVRAAERLVESLPWLLLHDEVSTAWIKETEEALDAADDVPTLPEGYVSLVATQEAAGAAAAAFLPVVGVMGAMESSAVGAAGGISAAGAAGAAGGGAGAAGAA